MISKDIISSSFLYCTILQRFDEYLPYIPNPDTKSECIFLIQNMVGVERCRSIPSSALGKANEITPSSREHELQLFGFIHPSSDNITPVQCRHVCNV